MDTIPQDIQKKIEREVENSRKIYENKVNSWIDSLASDFTNLQVKTVQNEKKNCSDEITQQLEVVQEEAQKKEQSNQRLSKKLAPKVEALKNDNQKMSKILEEIVGMLDVTKRHK
jgi:cysteinyl-tRNA synthetase